MPTMLIETRGILAGAYVRQDDARTCLTHAVEVTEHDGWPIRALCGKVKVENIVPDRDGFTNPADVPTCKTCARRDPRAKGDGPRALKQLLQF